jgi:fatty acid desaturase
MEDNANLFESLFVRLSDYGKTSYELVKLKAMDKTTEAVSSLLPRAIVLYVIGSVILFISLGLALWLGELLGKTYWGFFAVAGFWALIGIVLHFFMHKKLKALFGNYMVKQAFK